MIEHKWKKINYWAPCYQTRLRATLDKGPRIKCLETNWNKLNLELDPYSHSKNIFTYDTMSMFKDFGSNSRVQYKKCVIDMWKDCVKLGFFLFFFFLSFMVFSIIFFLLFYSYYTQWIFFLTFSPFSFITTTFFLGALLFELGTNLKLFYEFKSPSTYEKNWHFNLPLFASYLSIQLHFMHLEKLRMHF